MNKVKINKIFLIGAMAALISFPLSSCKNKKKKCDTCPQWGAVQQQTYTQLA